jgi:hypothetical protein
MDPTNNLGLTGLVSNITLTIQRESDGHYWNGAAWFPAYVSVNMTEVDPVTEAGRYLYNLPANANQQADRYIAHAKVLAVAMSGENYEVHESRRQDVRVYEAEPA